MTTSRRDVARGILFGWLASAIGYVVLGAVVPGNLSITVAAGIAVMALGVSLALGIVLGSMLREGNQATSEGRDIHLTLRYVTSTTEQVLLFLLAGTCLTLFAPEIAQNWLAEAGIWFLIARIMFAIGYAHDTVARSMGVTATFHPTLVLLALAAWGAFT